MEFVSENIDEYVRNLYEKCDEEYLVRKKKKKTIVSIQTEIRKLVQEDKVKQASDRLIEYLENQPTDDDEYVIELISHSANFMESERDLRMGTINREDAKVTKNKIRKRLLEIAKQCEMSSV
jgi:hypothetical protein